MHNNTETASIRALTLKDGVNYEDAKYDEIKAAQFKYENDNQDPSVQYPEGFNKSDDLNQDGQIDHIERAIKVNKVINKNEHTIEDKVKEDYLKRFRKEVDFHHKVAYRFEKAYRLGKKMTIKKAALNQEILNIIDEHHSYIEQDPMALFYCLYFCIYYNNPEVVEFLTFLISKMDNPPEKINQLLKQIVENGISRLRQIGEPLN